MRLTAQAPAKEASEGHDEDIFKNLWFWLCQTLDGFHRSSLYALFAFFFRLSRATSRLTPYA